MSTVQWEYEIVEKPFCEQLRAMGWQWIEGDPDLPETTERASSGDVLLRTRLAAALRRINLRDGQPWLDDARIAKAIRRHRDTADTEDTGVKSTISYFSSRPDFILHFRHFSFQILVV